MRLQDKLEIFELLGANIDAKMPDGSFCVDDFHFRRLTRLMFSSNPNGFITLGYEDYEQRRLISQIVTQRFADKTIFYGVLVDPLEEILKLLDLPHPPVVNVRKNLTFLYDFKIPLGVTRNILALDVPNISLGVPIDRMRQYEPSKRLRICEAVKESGKLLISRNFGRHSCLPAKINGAPYLFGFHANLKGYEIYERLKEIVPGNMWHTGKDSDGSVVIGCYIQDEVNVHHFN
jgi:hypothetical protein